MTSNPIYAYCSWCFEKTTHTLVERNLARRNVYQCDHCGERTLQCRACNNMAKGGKWDDELCAEHNGEIGSFARLKMKLDDITDYDLLLKRDSINLKRAGTISALALGGAAVLGPVAFAAAPAIGGAVGAGALGLSGAAASSAGLAAIGGGSIAAGGLGMAGGAAIIGATGAALGGTLGGVVSNAYFREVKGFSIELMKQGESPGVVCIDGFLTEKNPDPTDWKTALSTLYPNNAWYYVRWESKRLYDLGRLFTDAGGKEAVIQMIKRWALMATEQAGRKLGPISAVMLAMGIATNPWSIAMVKAGQTGILLADILARTDSQYILCGHSLGARVIHYATKSLCSKENCFIETAHLLGGAVGNKEADWSKTINSTNSGIRNYYSKDDWILASLYKTGAFFCSTPIGRNPIDCTNGRIKNYDVSGMVSGHKKYIENFPKYAQV